ncbi:hypothetical protein COOONC_11034 [Cooperia oncophora]
MLGCVNPFGVLQDFLARCFYNYGLFISHHPRAFAFGPLILTFFLAFGAFNVRMECSIIFEDDLRFLYSPEHSRSRLEYQIHKNFSGDTSNSSFVSVTLESMDHDKNLLHPEKCRLIRRLNKYIMENLTLTLNGQEVRIIARGKRNVNK